MSISLQNIANSHQHLGSFFDESILANLTHLFDANPIYNDPKHNIVAYIVNEHTKQQIPTNDLIISSVVHGISKGDPMLIAKIKYKNKPLVHFTIHLAPDRLNKSAHGMVHLVKNIYQNSRKYGTLKNRGRVRLFVSIPQNKPRSLHFTIMDGRNPPKKGNTTNDYIVQREMDILITVMNKIFDENDHYHYVGNFQLPGQMVNINVLPPIRPYHTNMPTIAQQINTYGLAITRKNKGAPYVIPAVDPSLLPFVGPATHAISATGTAGRIARIARKAKGTTLRRSRVPLPSSRISPRISRISHTVQNTGSNYNSSLLPMINTRA